MGLFKTPAFLGGKKKGDKKKNAAAQQLEAASQQERTESEDQEESGESDHEGDPLNLRENPPMSARGPLREHAAMTARPQSARPASAKVPREEREASPPQSGSLSARPTERSSKEVEAWKDVGIALRAANFLGSVALQTRGLFETVASQDDVGSLAELLQDGPIPASAALSGAVNPHAAATLLVFHLRDRPEGLLSRKTFSRWLAIPSLQGAEQEAESHELVKLLSKESRGLAAALFSLLRSVAEEHSIFYKDGVVARITALSQLFGPLLLRPTQDKEHPMACRTVQVLMSNPGLTIVPAPVVAMTPPAVPKINLPGGDSAAAAAAKKISIPMPKTVSFEREQRVPAGKENVTVHPEGVDEGYESDGTNYNVGPKAYDPDHEAFLARVAAASEDDVEQEASAAKRGGPLLKYSSRGKPVAVMFFKLSEDMSSLNWAPASSPSDLKYGLQLDHVEGVRVGRSASGSFLGGSGEPRRELRMVFKIGGGTQLEVEALSQAHVVMWSLTIQRIIMGRASAASVLPAGGLGTHRNWGAPETHRGSAPPAVPGLALGSSRPHAAGGSLTARLLNNVAMEAPNRGGGGGGSSTARAYGGRGGHMPFQHGGGSSTARGLPQTKEQQQPPYVDPRDVELLLSKARHKRLGDCKLLLDAGVPVDSQDSQGNTMLIVACQNNHRKVAKEALRRNCDVNHQNLRGHTCLHFCFAYKYNELGDYLIEKGADPGIINMYGRTCYQGMEDFARMEPQTPVKSPVGKQKSPKSPGGGGGGGGGGGKPRSTSASRGELDAAAAAQRAREEERRKEMESRALAEELEAMKKAHRELMDENSKLKAQGASRDQSTFALERERSVRSSPSLLEESSEALEISDAPEDRRGWLQKESKKYGSSKSTSPALEKEHEKRPPSQQPSTDTSLSDTAVSAPAAQAAETASAQQQQQQHQKVGASEAKATMGGMVMADPAKEGLGKGGKLSRLDVGGGVGGEAGGDSSSPVLSSAFSSISSAPSTGQQRTGVMGWLGGQGAGGKDGGRGGARQSPGSRNSPSRDAIRKAIERGLHETNGGVATGSTHRTEANTSFVSQSMAEISEISGSEREGTPDPSLSGTGKHHIGGSGNNVISPSIVEAESTVQLGGRERRKVASLVQAHERSIESQRGTGLQGGECFPDTPPVSSHRVDTTVANVSRISAVASEQESINSGRGDGSSSGGTPKPGGGGANVEPGSTEKNAKGMQDVLDEVREDVEAMEQMMAAVTTPFAVDTDCETDAEVVRREGGKRPAGGDWHNQLFQPNTGKTPLLDTPVQGRAFVGKQPEPRVARRGRGSIDASSLDCSTDSLSDSTSASRQQATQAKKDAPVPLVSRLELPPTRQASPDLDEDDSDTHHSDKHMDRAPSPYVNGWDSHSTGRTASRSSRAASPRGSAGGGTAATGTAGKRAASPARAAYHRPATAGVRGASPAARERPGSASGVRLPPKGATPRKAAAKAAWGEESPRGGTPSRGGASTTAAQQALQRLREKKNMAGGGERGGAASAAPDSPYKPSPDSPDASSESTPIKDAAPVRGRQNVTPTAKTGGVFVPSPEQKSPAQVELEKMRERVRNSARSESAFSPASRRR